MGGVCGWADPSERVWVGSVGFVSGYTHQRGGGWAYPSEMGYVGCVGPETHEKGVDWGVWVVRPIREGVCVVCES